MKAIAAAEASDVYWGYNGDKKDADKVTINKLNSVSIDASGKLEASAKGNIFLEDVSDNDIKLVSVKSNEGNVRVYGSKGIYNATSYKEGSDNNIINLSGKDLIIEAGNGSIGSSTVPVTTDMSGVITARSKELINLYQIGQNAMTFAAVYSGATLNIRAVKDILSLYSDISSDELGYIHSVEDMTILSDEGNIGEANGKGLRVKLEKDSNVNAEGESVYLKAIGEDTTFNLGNITARSGEIGIDAKKQDLVLNNDIKARNLIFDVRSLYQKNGNMTVSEIFKVNADNGIIATSSNNSIAEASLINNNTGDIKLYNNRDLILQDAKNLADNGKFNILATGSVTATNGIISYGDLFVSSLGKIDLQADSKAKNWIGLFADDGSIKTKKLEAVGKRQTAILHTAFAVKPELESEIGYLMKEFLDDDASLSLEDALCPSFPLLVFRLH